ncbi:C39 family peptidase [Mycobacterium sp. Aquia_216]|uniref:C39 family peptidase n=1 Tax=Mycobacterium sp. Aquia_216 TaxID=2991729 RepID=UPI003FA35D08
MTTKLGAAAGKAARIVGLAAFAACLTLGSAMGLAHADDPSAGGMYGDPVAAAAFWHPQTYDDCAVMAAADVIGEVTGHQVEEQEIIAVAQKLPSQSHPGSIYTVPKDTNDPNSGQGTTPDDLPVLLAHYGVGATLTNTTDAPTTGVATGMTALKHYLASGRKVIVEVNGEMIWGLAVDAKDKTGQPTSDHAVVVTGIDVVNGKAHLNDSGAEDGADEIVSLEVFSKAWATSDDEMIVTR